MKEKMDDARSHIEVESAFTILKEERCIIQFDAQSIQSNV
jgi:hypothetical protein